MTGRTRVQSVLWAAALAVCAPAAPAFAQTDTVERFEEILQGFNGDDAVQYQGISALGADGVLLDGVAFTAGPGAPPVQIDQVRIYSLDMDGWAEGLPPTYLTVDMVGVNFTGGPDQPGGNPLALLGLDAQTLSVSLDYQRAGSLSAFDPLRFDVPGTGSIEVRGQILNLPDAPIFASPAGLLTAQISELTIVATDDGLLARHLETAAADTGRSVAAEIEALRGALAAMLLGGDSPGPRAESGYSALSALLDDHAAPGPLTIRLQPATPQPIIGLIGIGGFEATADRYGLTLDYGG